MADTYARELVADIRREADRLEAALERERGDCAKLREALDESRRIALSLGGCRLNDYWKLNEIVRVCEAALAAPPRNCDRFATVDEARKAHEAICEKYGKCHNGCPLNNEEHYSAFDCFEAWLFATATEKEGGAE